MTDGFKTAIEARCQDTSRVGPKSVGPSSFGISLKSVRSKVNLLLVRSDSISKTVGPMHWTGPDRDRTEVVHPWKASATLSKQQFLHIQVYPPYRSSISSSATVMIPTSIQKRSWSIFAGLKFFSIYR